MEFLGDSLGPVYGVYHGTFTQPPCAPLDWVVAADVYNIRNAQIRKLQGLKDAEGNPIANNARDLQEIVG